MIECSYRVECDHCDQRLREDFPTMVEARYAATKLGWSSRPTLCPDCQENAE